MTDLLHSSAQRPLPPFMRLVLVLWNLLVTLACFSMFTWIVHDRRMPGWPAVLDRVTLGPLVALGPGVTTAVVADVLLFACFGLLHAGAARDAVYRLLHQTLGLVHKQALRTVFMTITAAGWLLLVFCWQPTGVTVWDLRPSLAGLGLAPALVDEVGPLLPFVFVLLCLGTVIRHGAFRFVGTRQLLGAPELTDERGAFLGAPNQPATDPSGPADRPVLLTTGVYGVVRHPMYTYLLASVVARPVLSLDLLLWFVCAVLFLLVALPLEEDKLIAIFGQQYRDYRRRTPAFIPLWPRRWTLSRDGR